MLSAADYQRVQIGAWTFWCRAEAADRAMLEILADSADREPAAKHPRTLPVTWPARGREYFLKVFHRRAGAGQLKDWLRQTKARRFWRQGLALAAAGFNVPVTAVLGEKRGWGSAERSFVLTEKIAGQPLPLYLAALNDGTERRQVNFKRGALAQLGALLRRFHDLGFVHGDLVASNIFIAAGSDQPVQFYFMDNDRTQRYPAGLTGHLRRRNLVQLNRLPLAHITLQDRMRFLRSYLQVSEFGPGQKKVAVWLERRTRQRRQEVDGADATVSFRRLMAIQSGMDRS